MTTIRLSCHAEQMAEKAEESRAFSGLKLLHVKKEIQKILALIGRNGIFDEYTKHDISHIEHMLESLDWIIPKKTQDILTSADWLMIALSIYFHDLGMLVTKDEFLKKENSVFPQFKKKIMDGELGLDYTEKVINLDRLNGLGSSDRFIYQELVRKHHADRIKYWILGEDNPNFPNAYKITEDINTLISNIDNSFRHDLAFICESHHLSDLDNVEKYKAKKHYGTSPAEIVNLHYSALVLRTADLLHITSDRTPSIEYSLINPIDPVSQDEWAKQRAVKAVFPQKKKNKHGAIDEDIDPDTLEISAFFEQENGFFGLITYLNYVDIQLKENFKNNESSNKHGGVNYQYPWKHIDDSFIEAKNFEKRQFEFILDQTKILNLLVGHTLYNDFSVVLRELTQNAIDAVRLKKYERSNDNSYTPEINIYWNDYDRVLSFIDNGTGMNLEIIQNHLLKVGASRYQDESFIKSHPGFSSISRFGIGLLTCFLVADDVDIITKSAECDKAIMLMIRKVHGKYLLKYLPFEKIPLELKEHGTRINLHIRRDVDFSKIHEEFKKWILLPQCKINLHVDKDTFPIGFLSLKDALEMSLKEDGYDLNAGNIKIVQVDEPGMCIAFALKYVEFWKEWSFLEVNRPERKRKSNVNGTCIEGIRVDFNTPGFTCDHIYAIVNTFGPQAPKTNVARSNIEMTHERQCLLLSIYKTYLKNIEEQLNNLINDGFSSTWAASEANWLLNSFIFGHRYNEREVGFSDKEIFQTALMQFECIIIERNNKREKISINKLKEINHFWTIDSNSYRSADSLIREAKSSNSSALTLLDGIFGTDKEMSHIDCLLCSQLSNDHIEHIIRTYFQVDHVRIIQGQRRLDLRWSLKKENIWYETPILSSRQYDDISRCFIQLLDFNNSVSDQTAIFTNGALFILKGSPLNIYLIKLIAQYSNTHEEREIILPIVSICSKLLLYKSVQKNQIDEMTDRVLNSLSNSKDYGPMLWSKIKREDFISALSETDLNCYNTSKWSRKDWGDWN